MTRAPIPVRIGFMPLVDCAPLVLASVLGFDRQHGVQLELSRESSWAGIRDKLLRGALDLAHALYGMVYGVQLGIGGPRDAMAVLMTINRNGQGISVSRRLADEGVRDLPTLAERIRRAPRELVFAQTFPTGTHALWLYHALASVGVHPLRDIRSIVLSPAQMVSALREGHADGVSVGAPWNRLGALQSVSQPLLSSSTIWPDHPEKVLAGRASWVAGHAEAAIGTIRAVLEASRWIEASPANRLAAAEILSGPAWVDTPSRPIADSLLGVGEPLPMRFFDEGQVNHPWLSDATWFMTQHKRWGLLGQHPDYEAVARRVQCLALYREAAAGLGIAVPAQEHRSSRLMDGSTWDGRDPRAYAEMFDIHQPAQSAAA
jgi:nitrate/nitrite transport system substrate-binding protein